MWAYVKDGVIKQINSHQTKLQPNPGVYFSAKYADEWTKEEKEDYGVYEIVQDKTNYKDPEYYNNGADTISFGSGKVTRVWATATAKSLTDTKWTQKEIDDGEAPTGADTNTIKTRGLTYLHKQQIKSQAAELLQDSDWYVIRKADAGTAVPSSITNFRAAVRTKAGEMETAIGNADTVDKLAALYVYTEQEDKSITRPLGEWPKLEDY
tara:strand:+ start:2114 stop:2740 length:627 start_codon:yes stop_codon:yes gene_type:complete